MTLNRIKDSKLLKDYYKSNPSTLDLKKYIEEKNYFSEYHTTDSGDKLTIKNSSIGLIYKPNMFRDNTDEEYELKEIKGINCLINSQRIIPCSRVYHSMNNFDFLSPFVIPDGIPVYYGGNLTKQVFSFDIMFYCDISEKIVSKETLKKFLENLKLSFEKNENWDKHNYLLRRLIEESPILNNQEKTILKLKYNTFSLLELVFLVEQKKINFDLDSFIYVLFESKNFYSFGDGSNHYIDLTETSKQIIEQKEIINFIKENFSEWNKLRFFLCVDYLESLNDKSTISYRDVNEKVSKKYYQNITKKLRNIENEIRLNKGYKIVGSYTNESILFQKVKDFFPNYEVISQGSPDWLQPQRLDIYFPKFNIGIEYQGDQHFRPIDFFGGEESFILNQKRDKKKRRKCKSNGCVLIEVLPNYNFKEIVNKIQHIIEDKNQ